MLLRHQRQVDFGRRTRSRFFPRRLLFRPFSYVRERILRIPASPHKVALGFAIGVFLACSPLLGLHIILAVFFSWILRGNFSAAIIGTIFSNPLTFLPLVMADYKIGHLCLSFFGDVDEISLSQIGSMFDGLTLSKVRLIFEEAWDTVIIPTMIGGFFLGSIFGGLSYIGVYRAIIRFQKRRSAKG